MINLKSVITKDTRIKMSLSRDLTLQRIISIVWFIAMGINAHLNLHNYFKSGYVGLLLLSLLSIFLAFVNLSLIFPFSQRWILKLLLRNKTYENEVIFNEDSLIVSSNRSKIVAHKEFTYPDIALIYQNRFYISIFLKKRMGYFVFLRSDCNEVNLNFIESIISKYNIKTIKEYK